MFSLVSSAYVGAIERFLISMDSLAGLRLASLRKIRLVSKIVQQYKEHPVPLVPAGAQGGTTNEAFVVRYQGSSYKVRHCVDIEKARRIGRWLRYHEHTEVSRFTNKYYGRRGRILVKAFVPGRQLLSFEEPEFAYQLGQFVGATHGLRRPFWATRKKADRCYDAFRHYLKKGNFSPQLANQIALTFRKNCPDYMQLAVTNWSIQNPSNFIVSGSGDLCLVDHERWSYDLPLCEVVPLFVEQFDLESRQRFLDGYESTGRRVSAFSDQLVVTELCRLLRRYGYIAKEGKDTTVIETRIQALIDGEPSILSY